MRSARDGVPDLPQGLGIVDGREISGIALFAQRLDRASKQLARAGLGQQTDKKDAGRSGDRTELRVDDFQHFGLELTRLLRAV